MTAGAQLDSGYVNTTAAALCLAVRKDLYEVQQFWAMLNTQGTAGLQVMGISNADATTLLAAFADLNGLANIFLGAAPGTGFGGQVATGPPYDFRTFIKSVTNGR